MERLKTNRKWLMAGMALLLCILLCPVKEVQAKWVPGWSGQKMYIFDLPDKFPANCTIQVEAGQTVYLNYCLGAVNKTKNGKSFCYAAELKGMTYTSSRKSVATVGKKTGLVKTKKAGETKITVTYNKKKYTCTLKVLKKGALKTTKKYKALNTAATALAKQAGVKVTKKNLVSLMDKTREYFKQKDKYLRGGYMYPYSLFNGFAVSGNKVGTKLIIPAMAAAETVAEAVDAYALENEPITGGPVDAQGMMAHWITIKSLEGKAGSSKITVKLNRAPTEADIYCIQYRRVNNYKTKFSKKSTTFTVSGIDLCATHGDPIPESYDTSYAGVCTLTAGSDTATIVMYGMTDKGAPDGKKAKLLKDCEYAVYWRGYEDDGAFFVAQ